MNCLCPVRRFFSFALTSFVLAVFAVVVLGLSSGTPVRAQQASPMPPLEEEASVPQPLSEAQAPTPDSVSSHQGVRDQEPEVSGFPTFQSVVSAPIVVELFSSQACIFCPRADRLFADLTQQPGIIGLACHIDYFDVTEGSFSQPFCTTRQKYYVEKLGTGPQYTPQMIMQGAVDVVGYRMADITAGLEAASRQAAVPLFIAPHPEKEERFIVTLPEDIRVLPSQSEVWLALFDKDKKIMVAEGRNQGQHMTYSHIVSQMEPLSVWEGQETIVALEGVHENLAGFAILVHNPETGHIFAAGQYLFPNS